ncbi:MAG: outer membrane protein [Conexibacter sp.]|nr:outer membrane protein [Conexibacter sp.]
MIARLLLLTSLLTLAVSGTAAAANSVPRWDRHFLIETAEGAHFEIKMGKIAVSKGRSREARSAGATMVRDHSGELHAVQALARSLGVKLPSGPSIMQEHEIGNTSQHTGAAFDRAYARLEVGDHIGDLQSADGESREGSLPAVHALAEKYRLMYQRHLAIFRALAAHVHAN